MHKMWRRMDFIMYLKEFTFKEKEERIEKLFSDVFTFLFAWVFRIKIVQKFCIWFIKKYDL